MTDEILLPYSDILTLRKQLRFKSKIPAILYYDQTIDGYNIWIRDLGATHLANITDSGEIASFESSVKPFCNKLDIPASKIIRTHDFSDNTSWQNGTNNSIYCIAPESGKDVIVSEIKGKTHKDLTFGTGQEFELVIWQGITAACPTYNNEKTSYGSPLYNPGQGVLTGWYKAYPSANDEQEVGVFVYFDNNVPQYMVTEFCFYSLDDFKDKAEYREDGDSLRFKYPFVDYGVFVNLRSSMNERIELFVNDDNEITRPEGSNIKSTVAAVILEYNEF